MPATTMYYGKKYGLVFESKSKKEVDILSHSIGLYFKFDYGKKESDGIKGNVALVIHEDRGAKGMVHQIFVKQPYDKAITQMRGKNGKR